MFEQASFTWSWLRLHEIAECCLVSLLAFISSTICPLLLSQPIGELFVEDVVSFVATAELSHLQPTLLIITCDFSGASQ